MSAVATLNPLDTLSSVNDLLAKHASLISQSRGSQRYRRRDLRTLASPPLEILKLPLIPSPPLSPPSSPSPSASSTSALGLTDAHGSGTGLPAKPKQVRQDLPPAKRARLARYSNYVPEEETIRNDYSQRYVDGGEWPQDWVLGADPDKRFEEYPKQQRLLALKKASVAAHALPPHWLPYSELSSLASHSTSSVHSTNFASPRISTIQPGPSSTSITSSPQIPSSRSDVSSPQILPSRPSTSSPQVFMSSLPPTQSNPSTSMGLQTTMTTTIPPPKFDVILIDPPFSSSFTWDDLADLPIPSLAADPSFIFVWVGSGGGGGVFGSGGKGHGPYENGTNESGSGMHGLGDTGGGGGGGAGGDGLERGREVLARWGFRRCEDVVWVRTNKESNKGPGTDPPTTSLLTRTKQHCLIGIKGTVRRSTDSWFVHCNVDTDVLIWEGDPLDPTLKPPEMYTLIENFCLGLRRLEIFGRARTLRRGWVSVLAEGEEELVDAFEPMTVDGDGGRNRVGEGSRYGEREREQEGGGEDGGGAVRWEREKWEKSVRELVNAQGGRLVVPMTSDIDALRPKSPMRGGSSNHASNPNLPSNPTGGMQSMNTSTMAMPMSGISSLPQMPSMSSGGGGGGISGGVGLGTPSGRGSGAGGGAGIGGGFGNERNQGAQGRMMGPPMSMGVDGMNLGVGMMGGWDGMGSGMNMGAGGMGGMGNMGSMGNMAANMGGMGMGGMQMPMNAMNAAMNAAMNMGGAQGRMGYQQQQQQQQQQQGSVGGFSGFDGASNMGAMGVIGGWGGGDGQFGGMDGGLMGMSGMGMNVNNMGGMGNMGNMGGMGGLGMSGMGMGGGNAMGMNGMNAGMGMNGMGMGMGSMGQWGGARDSRGF